MLRCSLAKSLVVALFLANAVALAGAMAKGDRVSALAGANAARLDTAMSGHLPLPFSINYPADPVTTSSATVNASTVRSNIVAGRALTLQAGNYGPLNIGVDNVDLIAQAGVSIASLSISANRVRITGGGGTTINGPLTLKRGATDLMIDNITVAMTGATDSIIPNGLQRIAFKNVTLTGAQNWVVIGGDNTDDFIFVDSVAHYMGSVSGRCPMRLVGIKRLVIANSRIASTRQGLRLHNTSSAQATTNFYIAGNQLEGGYWIDPHNGGGDGAGLVMGPGWSLNNNHYRPGETQMVDVGIHTAANLQNFTMTGHRGYGAATHGSAMNSISVGAGSTISNNLNQTYTGTPPYAGGAD